MDFFFWSLLSISQVDSTSNQNFIKIFYDCDYCDLTFIKQNLTMVEFVRDRQFADIHILITDQQNGAGGSTFMVNFIGQNEFKNVIDTVKYSTHPNMTDDEIRRMQLKYVQFGLLKYWLLKGQGDLVDLTIESFTNEEAEEDPGTIGYSVYIPEVGLMGKNHLQVAILMETLVPEGLLKKINSIYGEACVSQGRSINMKTIQPEPNNNQ